MCRIKTLKSLFDVITTEEAAAAGYTVHLLADGMGEVWKPDGTAYHIQNMWCDCPDAQHNEGGSYLVAGRRWCCHTALMARAIVCPACGHNMVWPDWKACDYFECGRCRNARHVKIVRMDRAKMMEIPYRRAKR